ncbi:alkaline phosphatase [Diplocarpon mali]|nr:alkaline phosphatase [Diplocarpon mali]
MLSGAADECGGLTLLGYNPLILKAANTYVEFLFTLFNEYTGPSPSELLRTSVPRYGLTNASEAEIATLEGHEDDISWPNALRKTLSERGGMNRSASDYSAIDAMLYGYSSGKGHGLLRQNTAGNWEDTQFSRYMEQQLGVD